MAACQDAARGNRQPIKPGGKLHGSVTTIAGKQLVTAVTAEGHGHVLPGQLGDIVGWDRGAVAIRLIEVPHKLGQDLQSVGFNTQFVMIRSQAGRDLASIARFVEFLDWESDGKGLHGFAAQ